MLKFNVKVSGLGSFFFFNCFEGNFDAICQAALVFWGAVFKIVRFHKILLTRTPLRNIYLQEFFLFGHNQVV